MRVSLFLHKAPNLFLVAPFLFILFEFKLENPLSLKFRIPQVGRARDSVFFWVLKTVSGSFDGLGIQALEYDGLAPVRLLILKFVTTILQPQDWMRNGFQRVLENKG